VGWVEGNRRAKTSLIRPVVSTQYQLVTDGRTDGQTTVTLKMHDLKMTDKENYGSGKCKTGK